MLCDCSNGDFFTTKFNCLYLTTKWTKCFRKGRSSVFYHKGHEVVFTKDTKRSVDRTSQPSVVLFARFYL